MNVALLGTWHVHAPEYSEAVISSEKANLVKVWDADLEKAKAFAAKYSIAYTDKLEEILEDETIDSVLVCTATGDHVSVIPAAAKAGKNIFTEKVLAFTAAEAEAIKKVVDESGVKFTISYPHRTWGKLKYAKDLLTEGKLGKITYARVRNVHSGVSDGWLPEHFFDKEQCGGGAMMDLGAHPMYTLAWLLGEPKSITSTFTSVYGKPVEDNAVSVLEFDGGVIGVSETGFVSKDNPYTLELSGTAGALLVHGDRVASCSPATDGEWKHLHNEWLPENDPLPIYQWIDAVVNNTKAPFGTDEAVVLSKLMEGAYKASESGEKYYF